VEGLTLDAERQTHIQHAIVSTYQPFNFSPPPCLCGYFFATKTPRHKEAQRRLKAKRWTLNAKRQMKATDYMHKFLIPNS